MKPAAKHPPPPPALPDIDLPLRTCKTCGREIFNPEGEGIAGDDALCTDCWGSGDQELECVG